jgi:hypothetical protein
MSSSYSCFSSHGTHSQKCIWTPRKICTWWRTEMFLPLSRIEHRPPTHWPCYVVSPGLRATCCKCWPFSCAYVLKQLLFLSVVAMGRDLTVELLPLTASVSMPQMIPAAALKWYWQGKTEALGEESATMLVPSPYPTWTALDTNSCLRCENSGTNDVRFGTARDEAGKIVG